MRAESFPGLTGSTFPNGQQRGERQSGVGLSEPAVGCSDAGGERRIDADRAVAERTR